MTRGDAKPTIAGRLASLLCGAALATALTGVAAPPASARNDVLKIIPHADLRVLDPMRLAEVVPPVLGGQWYPPTVARKNVSGILPTNVLAFWNITKG